MLISIADNVDCTICDELHAAGICCPDPGDLVTVVDREEMIGCDLIDDSTVQEDAVDEPVPGGSQMYGLDVTGVEISEETGIPTVLGQHTDIGETPSRSVTLSVPIPIEGASVDDVMVVGDLIVVQSVAYGGTERARTLRRVPSTDSSGSTSGSFSWSAAVYGSFSRPRHTQMEYELAETEDEVYNDNFVMAGAGVDVSVLQGLRSDVMPSNYFDTFGSYPSQIDLNHVAVPTATNSVNILPQTYHHGVDKKDLDVWEIARQNFDEAGFSWMEELHRSINGDNEELGMNRTTHTLAPDTTDPTTTVLRGFDFAMTEEASQC